MGKSIHAVMNDYFDGNGDHKACQFSSIADLNTASALSEHALRYRLLQERQRELAQEGVEKTLREIAERIGGDFAETARQLRLM
ncbi:MAG: hypothetical protein PHO92_03105 [Candidatus Peribacteraceae bacterium]|nr:hypothetical protein [Candidatus Peribacteraceae bacterium]